MAINKDDKADKNELRPYEADGIQEFDNPMPPWWINLFYATIVFSFIYLVATHYFGLGSLADELNRDVLARQALATQAAAVSAQTAVPLAEALKDPLNIKAGAEMFAVNCVACHGQQGEGGIGPNLCDDYWIHGGGDDDIVKIIATGVPAKGMPPWEPVLGDEKVKQLSAYVLSLRGTTPANAKAPQGELHKREGGG